ncbi:MAG: membrane dipeptidase [Chloroflexota bacterium]|nr:membrane dipeptidase [Chloroflexota bacterium]MDE2960629.1 membrane dipeptidase [Chloroflexota bacterium]
MYPATSGAIRPNRFSNDPEQSIECVLDHYDYMVNLVGVDHVAIGTDTSIGDSVGVGEVVMGRPGPTPARYMDGLESPADGKNIIRGLITQGYSDEDVRKIAGGNALALFRRVMG